MILSVDHLSYRYGKTPVLHDVAFTVATGEVVCLIGPNGAGKSTLLKCINLILRPKAGSVMLQGKPVEDYGRGALARLVSYVPQQAGSAMSLRVLDMVALGRAPHRGVTGRAHDRAIVWDAIDRLDLASLALRPFGELSGGQRQRVLIARALAQGGRLMLMDEPTSNLDPFYQLEAMSEIQAIAKERNIATLVALHDLSLAARIADGVVLMAEGRVHAQGCWRDVLTSANLEATYGVNAVIGSDQGLPYIIPVARKADPKMAEADR